MDVAVTGSTGLIGSALVTALRREGHGVRRLVRRPPSADDEVRWDPSAGTIDVDGLAGIDAVVHLAGEGIATRRWTDEQKRRILESRTEGTRLLAGALASLDPRPSVLLSGSAVGWYGDRGDDVLTEDEPRGDGFLADVVEAWEAAAAPAVDAGIRTVYLRTGIVLSSKGGALAKMLLPFRLGAGGPIAGGKQWWPWISLDDEVGAIIHLLTADVAGPVNLTGPQPVRNAEFTKALGRAVRRPAVLPIPSLGPRLLLGRELAASLLGDSQRVVPARLKESGYRFQHRDVDTALRDAVRRPVS
jgi:uncharacterized protein